MGPLSKALQKHQDSPEELKAKIVKTEKHQRKDLFESYFTIRNRDS